MSQTPEKPLAWAINTRAGAHDSTESLDAILPAGAAEAARSFHRQIPNFHPSPLQALPRLAAMLGLGGVWVKDESERLDLSSFKVLGGSFAIYRFLQQRLGMNDRELTFDRLISPEIKDRLGSITFASATDGNHGRGIAWASSKLGQDCVIYVHSKTSTARIKAIRHHGARVEVVDGTYDDAVRKIEADARENGWQVISDTSWDGYEDIPTWIMQGYTSMFSEAREELTAKDAKPLTHVFLQAGVGALAASGVAFYHRMFTTQSPRCVIVEPSRAACLLESIRAGDGQPHSFPGELDTIMAGLACGDPSPLAWRLLWDRADAFVAVPDYVAAKGMRVFGVPLKDDPPVISGESGAVTLGALMVVMEAPEGEELRRALDLGPDSQVLLINSEGNTDPDYFRRVVWEGVNPVPKPYRYSG
ncbi:MAG: diaminopropionate ammonia-lyase [Acidobacteriota bacterium]|nr:diaminopropionate ammonia-lyase [Acidobacteriota bacterium]